LRGVFFGARERTFDLVEYGKQSSRQTGQPNNRSPIRKSKELAHSQPAKAQRTGSRRKGSGTTKAPKHPSGTAVDVESTPRCFCVRETINIHGRSRAMSRSSFEKFLHDHTPDGGNGIATRRDFLRRSGMGMGMLGLAGLLGNGSLASRVAAAGAAFCVLGSTIVGASDR
jgi:hypothetical protein